MEGFVEEVTYKFVFEPIYFKDLQVNVSFRLSHEDKSWFLKVNDETCKITSGHYDFKETRYGPGTWVYIDPLRIVFVQKSPDFTPSERYEKLYY